jgi:Uma2 family endonuclease
MTAFHGNLDGMERERDPYAPTPPPGQDQLPSEDGVPMETNRHRAQMNLLVDTLADHWAERDDFYVGGNMFVYFSELQTKGEYFRGPDVFVVLDTNRRKTRKSWVVWEEGGKLPDVVIELLSDSTRAIDRGEKKRIYERVWKVQAYVLYDPYSHELEGYSRDEAGRFVPIAADASGDLPVACMGLSLGLRPGDLRDEEGPFLRWVDAGALVESGRELAERERARAEQERARAEQERARAEQERARAEQERARADAAERRLAELEAELARR